MTRYSPRLSRFTIPFLFFVACFATNGAFADGSVNFAIDIIPLLNQRPFLADFIKNSFSVRPSGWGIRIDSPTIPHTKGARIGPYEFQAIWHSAKGDVPVTLTIDTDIKYYDRHGRQITTNDLKPTVRIN